MVQTICVIMVIMVIMVIIGEVKEAFFTKHFEVYEVGHSPVNGCYQISHGKFVFEKNAMKAMSNSSNLKIEKLL